MRTPEQPESTRTPTETSQPASNPGTEGGGVSRQLKERHWLLMLKELQSESLRGGGGGWSLRNSPEVAPRRERAATCMGFCSPKVRGQLVQPHKTVLVPNLLFPRFDLSGVTVSGKSAWGQREAAAQVSEQLREPRENGTKPRENGVLTLVF